MLGAGVSVRDPVQEQPMEDWPMWWLLRTYFQSLGQARIPKLIKLDENGHGHRNMKHSTGLNHAALLVTALVCIADRRVRKRAAF